MKMLDRFNRLMEGPFLWSFIAGALLTSGVILLANRYYADAACNGIWTIALVLGRYHTTVKYSLAIDKQLLDRLYELSRTTC